MHRKKDMDAPELTDKQCSLQRTIQCTLTVERIAEFNVIEAGGSDSVEDRPLQSTSSQTEHQLVDPAEDAVVLTHLNMLFSWNKVFVRVGVSSQQVLTFE